MHLEAFLYGGVSAVLAELASYPIDTCKIRLQVQGQVTDDALTAIKYRGTLHTLISVCSEEGFFSLYNGFRFAALRQATYGTLRFGIFFSIKRLWNERGGTDKNLPFLIGLGTTAGVTASVLTTPIDRMKVLSQSTAQTRKKRVFNTFKRIYSKGGISGLYQGILPNAKRAAAVNGAEIPCYVFVKDFLTDTLGFEDNMLTQFYCAVTASAVGICISQPFDTAKTRIMQQKTHRTDIRVYEGFIDMCRLTISNEGRRALWKGAFPAWCRNGPWNIVFYLAMERFRKFDQWANQRDHSYF